MADQVRPAGHHGAGQSVMENDVAAPYRFSVVIPAYNEAGYLESALKSLYQQDFAGPYEVIVVDNNSTDDTADIARRHGAWSCTNRNRRLRGARQRGTMMPAAKSSCPPTRTPSIRSTG